jgi:hypothetical protein
VSWGEDQSVGEIYGREALFTGEEEEAEEEE